MIATALLLGGCGNCSETLRTETILIAPPAALLADCPPPLIPDPVETRDQMRDLTLDLAAWGMACRTKLTVVRQWVEEHKEK